jgi:hypothetical protein
MDSRFRGNDSVILHGALSLRHFDTSTKLSINKLSAGRMTLRVNFGFAIDGDWHGPSLMLGALRGVIPSASSPLRPKRQGFAGQAGQVCRRPSIDY